MAERILVQVRLDSSLVKVIDHMAVDAGEYRGEVMDALLREAITQRGGHPADVLRASGETEG